MAQRKLDSDGLLQYGLKLLQGRGLSVSDLRDRLRRRAADPADVDKALSKFKEYGYLNDRRFAENLAASRISGGYGRGRVLRDLRQKRVAPAVAGEVVREAFRDTDEVAQIESFLDRKLRRTDIGSFLADEKHLAAAYRKLRYAGFSAGNSIRVLKRYAAKADELEGLEETEGESKDG
jgi:regulatory protein